MEKKNPIDKKGSSVGNKLKVLLKLFSSYVCLSFGYFVKKIKTKVFLYKIGFVLLCTVILGLSPYWSVPSPSNFANSLSQKLNDTSFQLGTSPLGAFSFDPPIHYYRENDIPATSILELWQLEPSVLTFKTYKANDITISFDSFGFSTNVPLVATTTTSNDNVRDTTFYPADSDGGNSWIINSSWEYMPSGVEIGIPKQIANQLLGLNTLDKGDYASLLGETVVLTAGKSQSIVATIKCIFDDKSASFGKLSDYFDSFCLIRLENNLNCSSEILFDYKSSSKNAFDYIKCLEQIFPENSYISNYKLSFYWDVDGSFTQIEDVCDFISDMVSLTKISTAAYVLIAPSMIIFLSGILCLIVFLKIRSIDCQGKNHASLKTIAVCLLISLLLSLFFLGIAGRIYVLNAYFIEALSIGALSCIVIALVSMAIVFFVAAKIQEKLL